MKCFFVADLVVAFFGISPNNRASERLSIDFNAELVRFLKAGKIMSTTGTFVLAPVNVIVLCITFLNKIKASKH